MTLGKSLSSISTVTRDLWLGWHKVTAKVGLGLYVLAHVRLSA